MTILHDDINGDQDYNSSDRTVLLHQHAVNESASFTTAHFDRSDVHIVQMKPNGKAKSMRLTPEEADALVAAYSQFKLDVEAAKLAAIQADAEARSCALSLAREMRSRLGEFATVEIRKVDKERNIYMLSIPALNWTYYRPYSGSNHIYTGAQLETAVKAALRNVQDVVENHWGATTEQTRAAWGDRRAEFESAIATWREHEAFFAPFLMSDEPDEQAESSGDNTVTFTIDLANG